MDKLLPCPFCGGDAEPERAGTHRASCIMACLECGCRVESNEMGFGDAWNTRALNQSNVCISVRCAAAAMRSFELDRTTNYGAGLEFKQELSTAIKEAK